MNYTKLTVSVTEEDYDSLLRLAVENSCVRGGEPNVSEYIRLVARGEALPQGKPSSKAALGQMIRILQALYGAL